MLDINDENVMSVLTNIADKDIIRAYLNYALLTGNAEDVSGIVRAYYSTGYTVDSLKLVTQVVPFDDAHLELYAYVYGCVMSYTFSPRITNITENEILYLREFFSRGLSSTHESINEDSQKGLTQLDKL